MEEIFTTRSACKLLGIKQDTLKRYAERYGIGYQPGGKNTTWVFFKSDIIKIQKRRHKWFETEKREDREGLGLPPIFNPNGSPNF